MKIFQIKKFVEANDYILVRLSSGHTIGINCKVAKLKNIRGNPNSKQESWIKSFVRAISFQEYISKKIPFIIKK